MTVSSRRDSRASLRPLRLPLFAVLTPLVTACAHSLVRATADGGPAPLDSARAVAIARDQVCGGAGDSSCVVLAYARRGGQFDVTLDRRPPAGADRVTVTLRDGGRSVAVAPALAAGPPAPR